MFNPQTADWSKFMTRWMWWKGYVWPGVQRERMDRTYRSLGYHPLETPYGRMWVKDERHPLLQRVEPLKVTSAEQVIEMGRRLLAKLDGDDDV